MDNLTSVALNGTLTNPPSIDLLKILSVVPFFTAFLYANIMMLYTFFSEVSFRESSRYVLFAHMLANDTLQLVTAVSMHWLLATHTEMPFLVCYLLTILGASTYLNTPLNLAAMSLERYIAICIPLKHAEICRVERSWIIITVIWIMSLYPFLFDFISLCTLENKSFFFQNLYCFRESLILTPVQNWLRSGSQGIEFSLVAVIILYTYARIMLVAKKASGNKPSVSKARKTVMLHAVQLGLCLTSFTYPITANLLLGVDHWFYKSLLLINFVLFILFPRVLSSLIYGLRVETFKIHLKKSLPSCSKRIRPILSHT
uniref:G-protein coupled receptors family 1 profile domain-containing protein n=2 Tax=Latimeria chalumnae TaxID=7897 RepID=H3A319_LATCH